MKHLNVIKLMKANGRKKAAKLFSRSKSLINRFKLLVSPLSGISFWSVGHWEKIGKYVKVVGRIGLIGSQLFFLVLQNITHFNQQLKTL